MLYPPAVGVSSGLWELPADDNSLSLSPGQIYHYWIEVDNSRSTNAGTRIAVTDPFAACIDWRVFYPDDPNFTQPVSVVRYLGNGTLEDCYPNGEKAELATPDEPQKLPKNNQIVIYKLPTAWTISRSYSQSERDFSIFLDVAALADESLGGAYFAELDILAKGSSYLSSLGTNAVELLPPADSLYNREWGYGTSHYLAPDYELGYLEGNYSPTANRDLAQLVSSLHAKQIRFFVDVVMTFAKEDPYNYIDVENFHIDDSNSVPNDPDAKTLGRTDGRRDTRNGFGSTLFRYAKLMTTYDPVSEAQKNISPAAQYMLVCITHWMQVFRVDGLRLDSVENIGNWDFVKNFKDCARQLFADRWQASGQDSQDLDGIASRFFVVGEQLKLPIALIKGKRLDGLWNELFQERIRAAILGEAARGDNFEWTVRNAINYLFSDGSTDGSQVINYITKHDVEGFRHERLFTMLSSFPRVQIEKSYKLAFTCLLRKL